MTSAVVQQSAVELSMVTANSFNPRRTASELTQSRLASRREMYFGEDELFYGSVSVHLASVPGEACGCARILGTRRQR